MSVGRPGGYLYKRKGSNNWWVRFQYTGEIAGIMGKKKYEASLRTPDYDEARLRAHEMIRGHLTMLVVNRKVKLETFLTEVPSPAVRFEPNRKYYNDKGEEFWATEDELIFIDQQGKPTRRESNRQHVYPQTVSARELGELRKYIPNSSKNHDASFIHRWIEKRGLNEHIKREALGAWKVFRELTNNKPLRLCKRSDGILLVKKLYEGNKSATVEKKIGHLRAAVNVAMLEDSIKLDLNPFQGVFENRNDKEKRESLSDVDMMRVRSNLDLLREEDQILWRLLAQTGMRLSEPFQIQEILDKKGVKCVHVGTKTEASDRFVPIPTDLIAAIPDQLNGFLFKEGSETVGKRLRRFLRRLEISQDSRRGTGDPRKTIHSLRHRAKDCLRDLECPDDIQLAILGHKTKSVADRYGTQYSMDRRLRYIDKIGY